ncbi:hypothetical protein [Tenacibaculum jejuense]|nr:hypothetical protein [Tenacibaculum jejuense]
MKTSNKKTLQIILFLIIAISLLTALIFSSDTIHFGVYNAH